MKKWIIGGVILSGIGVGFFLMQGKKLPFGLPTPSITLPWAQSAAPAPVPTTAPVTVYQYRNEDGFIELSSQPPPAGVEYTIVTSKGVNRVNQMEQPSAASSWISRVLAWFKPDKKQPATVGTSDAGVRDAASAADTAPSQPGGYAADVRNAAAAVEQMNKEQLESTQRMQQAQ